jgi:hypothetical protein
MLTILALVFKWTHAFVRTVEFEENKQCKFLFNDLMILFFNKNVQRSRELIYTLTRVLLELANFILSPPC